MRQLVLNPKKKFLNGTDTTIYDKDAVVQQSAQELMRRLHTKGNPDVNSVNTKPETLDEEPKQSDYTKNAAMLDTLMVAPMSAEEEAKRKRAATAVEGIGHLGNVMNAFSNLVFVNKGAPNQALPTVPSSELDKFEDRVRDNRAKYMQSRMLLENADKSEFQNAWERWNTKQQQKIAQKRYDQEFAYRQERDKIADEQGAAQIEREQANLDRNYNLQKQAQEQSNALRWAEHNERVKGGYYNKGNKSDYRDTINLPDGRYLQLDREKIGKTLKSEELNKLYQQVPEEIKRSFPLNSGKTSENVDNMYNAIFAAAQSSPAFVQEIIRGGYGAYIEGEEEENKSTQGLGYVWGDSNNTNNKEIQW